MRQELADSLAATVTAVPGWKAWIVPIPAASRGGPAEYEVRVQRKGLDEIPLHSLAEWLDIQQRLAQTGPAVPLAPAHAATRKPWITTVPARHSFHCL